MKETPRTRKLRYPAGPIHLQQICCSFRPWKPHQNDCFMPFAASDAIQLFNWPQDAASRQQCCTRSTITDTALLLPVEQRYCIHSARGTGLLLRFSVAEFSAMVLFSKQRVCTRPGHTQQRSCCSIHILRVKALLTATSILIKEFPGPSKAAKEQCAADHWTTPPYSKDRCSFSIHVA